MKFPWFKRMGMLFMPATAMGWLILLTILTYSVFDFLDIDSRSHSVSDTLMNFCFNLVMIGLVYSAIAWLTSRPSSK